MAETRADYLFEASWEVCNKVGGIYTVVASKAALINEAYPNYFLVGPYVEENARQDLIEEPPHPELFKVFEELYKEGIVCHYGTWQIKGNPKAILLDFRGFSGNKNGLKKWYWDTYKIDSLRAGWDFEEPMLWSTAVGKLIEKFCQFNSPNGEKKVVAHLHEWMAGFALLYLKPQKVKCGCVFTTHATMLGRSIAGAGGDLYNYLEQIDPIKAAYDYGIEAKHLTEVACALNADVFTTVSEITSIEAEKLLGRKAEVLVLNGLDMEKFPTYEECAIMHRENRETIREFVSYYFFPHYHFDIAQTLLFFIVGRYEYRNKGLDIFIKSLAKLNERLKETNSEKTVIAFFWIPRDVHGAKTELSLNKANYIQIKDFVRKNTGVFQRKIIDNIMKCSPLCFNDEKTFYKGGLFDDEFLKESKIMRINFQKKGNPLIVTHNLPFEESDAIVRGCLNTGLDNKEDDKVKIIFYPVYLTGIDGLIDLPYYQAITGCHLGLFPSYYEPWGYTPLESAALGVPSLTTDLGGFGRFLQDKANPDRGIFVLKRFKVSEEETVNHFTDILFNYTLLHEKGRVQQKIAAKELAALSDWNELVKNYYEAHNLAVQKVWK